ncbi:MAG: hypothetical protein HY962_02050 [Ignavibacteriae bacterium]|nr:hypothetical protein [Ignavibacteriota bacterium]
MNKLYFAFALFLAGAVGLLVLGGSPGAAVGVDSKVTFSHSVHKGQTECATCHPAADSENASDNLLPKPEACASCHDAKDVRGYWGIGENDPLDKAYLTVADRKLRFSHKFHAGSAGMNCESCHGAVLTDASEGMPSMESCYDCHNDGQKLAPIKAAATEGGTLVASNRCELCHTSLAGMVPKNHRSVNYIRLHGRFATSGEAERECAVCHSASFCQECHTPTNDVPEGNAKDKFYIGLAPRGEKVDDGKLLTSQQVHSLTYRYTHGFDARAQSTHCERCHEPESFCTPCHQNGFDANGARIVPQSHQLAGFVQLGGGEALNRHGKMAERDMASCATCHEVDGGDPICAPCHSTGLVKGGDR